MKGRPSGSLLCGTLGDLVLSIADRAEENPLEKKTPFGNKPELQF